MPDRGVLTIWKLKPVAAPASVARAVRFLGALAQYAWWRHQPHHIWLRSDGASCTCAA